MGIDLSGPPMSTVSATIMYLWDNFFNSNPNQGKLVEQTKTMCPKQSNQRKSSAQKANSWQQ